MQDIMCGKRGPTSFKEATLAQKNGDSFECQADLTACSVNQDVDGTTYCVDLANGEQCPITEIRVYDDASFEASEIKNNPLWESRTSSSPTAQGEASQLIMAFTKKAGKTNSPLQALQWNSAVPCAYLDESDRT